MLDAAVMEIYLCPIAPALYNPTPVSLLSALILPAGSDPIQHDALLRPRLLSEKALHPI